MHKKLHSLFSFLLFISYYTGAQSVQVPAAIAGHWLQPQTAEWMVSFPPMFAVYKGGFWNCTSIQGKQGLDTIGLKKGTQRKNLRNIKGEHYLLVNKSGEAVLLNAPQPAQKEEVLKAMDGLLRK